MREPHAHQAAAITALRTSLAGKHRRPMLMLPTGAGKTLIAAWVIQGALAKGKRVAFTCPALSLIDQTAREFWKEGIRDIGVMQADHAMTDPTKPVQICSIDTLARRDRPKVDLVLVDEAHRRSKFMSAWIHDEQAAGLPFIGLSATPWTKGLGRDYDDLVIGATTKQLIESGHLCRYRSFAPSHPDLGGVKTIAGDYHEGQLSAAMQRGTLVGDIVTTWQARAEGRPTFVFAVDLAHARTIQRQFEQAGEPCAYLDASSPPAERERVRQDFMMNRVRVVVNVGVLTTGIDWDVRAIVLARPTKSEILYVQIVGRGLRNALGKKDLMILDHSDTTAKLGFVDEIMHYELDDGEVKPKPDAKEEEALPKECPACAYLMPPKTHTCPACGQERPKRLAEVKTVSGDIVEIGERIAAKRNREEPWEAKIAFIGSLKRYQILTGKKPGWVAHKYRERFGVWPDDPRVKYAAPADVVAPEVSSWLRSRQIAWAHSRDRA